MAYKFTSSGQYLNFGGTDATLFQARDMSIGFWLYVSGAPTFGAAQIITEDANFTPMATVILGNSGDPWSWGVRCHHALGGGFSFGVNCVPAAVNHSIAFSPGSWRYFGFSRSGTVYKSYYGSRNSIVACQQNDTGTLPNDLTVPGQHIQTGFLTGFRGCDPGYLIGPFSYWSRAITMAEHLAMARCSPLSMTGMLLWCKMRLPPFGPVDQGPFSWGIFTRPGPDLPPGVQDQGCASFSTGNDYALTSP